MNSTVHHWIRDLSFGLYHALPYDIGKSVLDREWDVLILLDACRPDALQEFQAEFGWLSDIEPMLSVGSDSAQWMDQTFGTLPAERLGTIGYITGNPFSAEYAPSQLGHLDEVWRYAWDEDLGAMPARPITDRSITAHRTVEFDKMIVHYMQPHFPCIPNAIETGYSTVDWGKEEMQVWERAKKGEIGICELWDSYLDNLRYVLREVDILLHNISSGRVAISADHGEAFGEWGLYGHGPQPAPVLRKVPWVITSATDEQDHEPKDYSQEIKNGDRQDKLRALGYR